MNLGGAIRVNKTGICLIAGALVVLFVYVLTTDSSSSAPPSVKINLKQLLQVSIKAAENGGKEVVSSKDNLHVKSKGLTKEGLQDSVTTADYSSHCAIMKTLKHAYPTLNIISEEKNVECKDNEVDFDYANVPKSLDDYLEDLRDITVWIDPLDATYEFSGKLYDYVTTMVCVAVRGQPVIGVIHKPFNTDSKTYWAWLGKARSPNLKYVKKENDNLKIIISMSHSGEIKKVLSKNFKNVELISAAGAGYKSLEVAAGNVDAYLHMTAIKKWDICAGNAILNAIGGTMTTKLNKLIDYKDQTNVKNEEGLVATMTDHDRFIGKF